MTGTMKAAVLESFGQPLAIKHLPIPVAEAGQVLVRVAASGVCHTDLHTADGDWPVRSRLPVIPGHEGVGCVAAVGPGVKSLKEGDRVGVPWLYSACGACEYCLTGRETLCLSQKNTGYSVNGAHAEYMVAPAAYAVRLPDRLEYADAAPILCAGVTTYKGLKQTDTKPGDWVVISGVGGIGHMAVQYAKAMGLHVVAVDIDDQKLALARALGAELTLNAATESPINEVRRSIGGAHGVLITAVSLKAVEQGIGLLRRGGTCVLVGIPPGKFALSTFDLVVKGLTVRGSIVGTRQDLSDALQFAAEGKAAATIEIQSLDAINATLDRLRDGKVHGRVVLRMNGAGLSSQ